MPIRGPVSTPFDTLELDTTGVQRSPVKLHDHTHQQGPSLTTINHVADELGEDGAWLRDIADEMEVEDGIIWVYGVGEDGIMAFTDFESKNLMELVKMHKKDPKLLVTHESPRRLE